MNDFHHTSQPTARKPHRCVGCGGIIQVGETYTRFTGVSDGDFYSVAMKLPVAELYTRLNEECWRLDSEGLCFQDLIDHVCELLTNQPLDEQTIADARRLLTANPSLRHLKEHFDKTAAAQVGQVITAAMQ